MKRRILLALLGILWALPAVAQPAVFVVRHAERADDGAAMMATDPDLSAAGRARAEALAALLKDAGVTAIFATQYKRTQQTAEPLARQLGLSIEQVHSDDIAGLVERVRKANGNALVVSHSGSVPKFLGALGVPDPPELAHGDYDNLFVVSCFVMPGGGRPTMVRLHFPGAAPAR